MRNISISPIARLLIGCTALVGATISSLTQADTLDKIKDSSSVRIGYANETPFAYTATDGSVTGESPKSSKRSSSAWASRRSTPCSPNGAR